MKTTATRSTELMIEHSCGESFGKIPDIEIDEISDWNPVITYCPRCKEKVIITNVLSDDEANSQTT